MRKISRFSVLSFIFWSSLMLINFFYFQPFVDNTYFHSDVLFFKNDSWKYSIIVFILILIVFVVYGFKTNMIKIRIWNFALLALISFFLSSLLKNFTDNFLLYINKKISHKSILIVYKVIENKENEVFELYDYKNFITYKEELDKINNQRINNNLKSVYDYKNNDTLQVSFNYGFLKVKYLE
jgi:hypothetical protein